MWDFAANVEGSEMAYSLVADLAARTDEGKELASKIEDGYAALKQDLATYGSLEDGFTTYSDLTDDDRRVLTDDINALAEPLSQLTATILE
jgi:iron uptake system component EfeO